MTAFANGKCGMGFGSRKEIPAKGTRESGRWWFLRMAVAEMPPLFFAPPQFLCYTPPNYYSYAD